MNHFVDDDSQDPLDEENFKTSKRDILVNDHLNKQGISSIDDAPDELIEEAHEEADKFLGEGNDN